MTATAKKADFDARLADAKEPEIDQHQREWETAVLATLAHHIRSDESALKWLVLRDLSEDDLRFADHREVFRAMKALHDQGDGVDRTTVGEWLKINKAKVADQDVDPIFAASPVDDFNLVKTYLDRIVARGRFRQARDIVRTVLQELEQAEKNADPAAVDDAVGRVQAVAFDLTRTKRLVGDAKTEAESLPSFLADLELRQSDRGFVGLDAGFPHLNQVLNGLGQGLFIFAGPPSSGKTTFLKQLADQVAEKEQIPVLFFSFEQSAEELRIKTLARLAKVNSRDIIKGRTTKTVEEYPGGPTVEIWTLVEGAGKKYQDFGRFMRIVEADRETTIGKIRILAQAAKQQTGADRVLIVIDYLQILPVQNQKDFGSTKDRVDWICSELRRLARDLNSPVIAISSENREAYKGNSKPTLAAFKETGGIEYSADVAVALWTDPQRTEDLARNGDNSQRAVDLFVMKNRNGELATIRAIFQPDVATFKEVDKSLLDYTSSFSDRVGEMMEDRKQRTAIRDKNAETRSRDADTRAQRETRLSENGGRSRSARKEGQSNENG